ncbi:MAG: hypothetical protein IT347_04745 [Candidatus Eisenbacteria bacterium]|nr:hypothetical protein [Candidatus Eisenbacteria bacterium]
MIRFRPWAVPGAVLVCLLALSAGRARAAAEVHRLNLMLSGIPTSVAGGDFNDAIERYNKLKLDPVGYEHLEKIAFTWAFDGELRYFVRPNFAVTAGISHLRAGQRKEFLPSITTGINLHTEVLTVPVHVGAAYYLQPYNQGDFQARAYFGAGMVQYTHTRARFEQVLSMATFDSTLYANSGGTQRYSLTQDAPGYYVEGGGHMFFASRFSAMVGVVYRSGVLRGMVLDAADQDGVPTSTPRYTAVLNPDGSPYKLDVSGIGVKLAVGIGF